MTTRVTAWMGCSMLSAFFLISFSSICLSLDFVLFFLLFPAFLYTGFYGYPAMGEEYEREEIQNKFQSR